MKFYFSRKPGCYLNEITGEEIKGTFSGSVREWYEILAYAISRHAKQVFGNNDLFEAKVSPDVLTILQCTLMMSLVWSEKFSAIIQNQIKVNNEYIVKMDTNQQRNIILVQQNDKKFEVEIKDMGII